MKFPITLNKYIKIKSKRITIFRIIFQILVLYFLLKYALNIDNFYVKGIFKCIRIF